MYVLMAVEYRRFVFPNYQHLMGFQFVLSPLPIILGVLFLALLVYLLFFMRRSERDELYPVAMIVALLFCLPAIVMYQFGGITVFVPLYGLLFLGLLCLPIGLPRPLLKEGRGLPRFLRAYRGVHPYTKEGNWRKGVLPVVCLLCLLPFPLAFGWNLDFSLLGMGEEIYDVRAEVATKNTLLTAYLLGPLRMVLLPMLIVYGLTDLKHSWWMTLLGVCALVFLYLLNPQKSIFFAIPVVLAMFCFKDWRAKAGVVLYGLLLACAATALMHIATGALLPESIVLRRLFFIPILVCDNYFSFFDGNPLYLSHSVLGHWIDYPYDLEPSRVIGQVMYGSEAVTNCNTGVLGDGFMNFGHIGAILFVALCALYIRIECAVMDNPRFFGLVALLVYTFLNSALFTTLLTHGGLVLLLASLFFIPKGKEATC